MIASDAHITVSAFHGQPTFCLPSGKGPQLLVIEDEYAQADRKNSTGTMCARTWVSGSETRDSAIDTGSS